MTAGERREVTTALVDRLLAPYTCRTGTDLAARRTGSGNQATVIGTAAVLAGLAVRADAAGLVRGRRRGGGRVAAAHRGGGRLRAVAGRRARPSRA